MALIDRFKGESGRHLLVEALRQQSMLAGAIDLAEEIAERGELLHFEKGTTLIEQADDSNDVFLIVGGACAVSINGRRVAIRGPRNHVGEMAAIQPTQARSATVSADEPSVVVRLTEKIFTELAGRNPQIYRAIAQELARRLLERNKGVGAFRTQVRIFIISSVEALPVARIISDAFEHDPFAVQLWTEGCFKVSNYTLQALEDAVDNSDFALAIAHADDYTTSRRKKWPSPRDNVIFELGLFMGRLGRARAILMEPREQDVKLPSDLAGITTIAYRFEKGGENIRLMAPACNKLRNHVMELGPHNG